ncbi:MULTISPECIES: helix-turn-helix domain-containing protein [Bacteroidales]|uniref:helix-turn-helix domain-containing protein n=1 Tax=Bacteroidales TaxID=171549 RepID=UPI002592E5F2|nr:MULTISPECIES: helix-turn-helix domain-containing protein [Bacteroidales]
MDTIEIEREVFDALINRVDFLHKTVKVLYKQLRDKKLSDWLTTKQTCDYLHISERKLRSMKERGKIGFSHLGRLSQFKGGDIARVIVKEEGAVQ